MRAFRSSAERGDITQRRLVNHRFVARFNRQPGACKDMRYLIFIVGSFALLASAAPKTGTVTVKGVHLCCGGCLGIANEALSEVEGVDGVSCDLNTKVITYKADD